MTFSVFFGAKIRVEHSEHGNEYCLDSSSQFVSNSSHLVGNALYACKQNLFGHTTGASHSPSDQKTLKVLEMLLHQSSPQSCLELPKDPFLTIFFCFFKWSKVCGIQTYFYKDSPVLDQLACTQMLKQFFSFSDKQGISLNTLHNHVCTSFGLVYIDIVPFHHPYKYLLDLALEALVNAALLQIMYTISIFVLLLNQWKNKTSSNPPKSQEHHILLIILSQLAQQVLVVFLS